MAKIADLDLRYGYSAPLIQLKDDLVMNGAVYEINNLYAEPFKNIRITSSDAQHQRTLTGTTDHSVTAVHPAHYGHASSNYAVRGRRSGNFTHGTNFLVDNVDSSVGYYLCNEEAAIYKINLNTKQVIATGSTPVDSHVNAIMGQSDDYIFWASTNNASAYYNSYFGSIDKATLTTLGNTAISTGYRYCVNTFLAEDANNLYMSASETYSGYTHRLLKIVKGAPSSADVGNLQASPDSSIPSVSVPSQSRIIDGSTDAVYASWPANSVNDGIEIYKYQINRGLETVVSSLCTLDFLEAGVTRADVLNKPTGTGTNQVNMEVWLVTGGSSDYVCVGISENANFETEVAASFRIYMFRIESTDTNLTYVGQIDPSVRVRSYISLEEDWTKVAVVFDGGVKIYDWNASTETYDFVDEYSVDVTSIMVDRLERIWILDTTNVLHMFSATTPIRITVTMQNETYNYTGSTINTYANVSAWNTDGNRVAANVKLVLEGSAEFTNGSKSKTFATSASAETQIDINITGSSYSRAIASVVV